MPYADLAPERLLCALREELDRHADGRVARRHRSTLKGPMPFLGIPIAQLPRLLRPVLAADEHRLTSPRQWATVVTELWRDARHREEWYASIALTWYPPYRAWAADPRSMPLYRDIISTSAWWDVVDPLATHTLGRVLDRHFETESGLIRSWAIQEDVWLRRAALLSQAARGARTDRSLLAHALASNATDRSPYIRSALATAGRAYARTGPEAHAWVASTLAGLGVSTPTGLACDGVAEGDTTRLSIACSARDWGAHVRSRRHPAPARLA